MMELTLESYGQALVDETARFADTVRGAAAEAPVPTCPEWTLSKLVEHLGQTQHWVAAIVEERVTEPSQLPASVPALPADQDAWAGWLTEGATRLATASVDAGLDAPVWNPAGDGRTGTQFWLRRIVAETVIHRADAALSADVAYDLAPDLAADVITDHLAMMTSPAWAAQVPESAAAMRGEGQSLQLTATDTVGEWQIHRSPDAATWRHGSGAADVTASGPAATLLLVLTRRLPLSAASERGLQISGDPTLLAHWVEHTAHEAK